jgi:hypothetical protein
MVYHELNCKIDFTSNTWIMYNLTQKARARKLFATKFPTTHLFPLFLRGD